MGIFRKRSEVAELMAFVAPIRIVCALCGVIYRMSEYSKLCNTIYECIVNIRIQYFQIVIYFLNHSLHSEMQRIWKSEYAKT